MRAIDVASRTPVVDGPLTAEQTTITVSGVDATATQVEVFVNGESAAIDTAPAGGGAAVTIAALVAGDSVYAV